MLPRKGAIERNSGSGRFALGVRGRVTLSLQHDLKRPVPVRLHDGLPPWSEADDLPWLGVLPPDEVTHVTYDLHFTRRGAQTFSAAHLLATSHLGLWERLHRVAGGSETRCYPNYEPVVRFALLATANREEQMGIIRKRKAGAALDFHQLRDYQDGDVLSRDRLEGNVAAADVDQPRLRGPEEPDDHPRARLRPADARDGWRAEPVRPLPECDAAHRIHRAASGR